jgi:hypothetical protein
MRSLGLFAVLTLAGLPGVAASASQDSPQIDKQAHAFAERRFRFENAWHGATPEDRDRLRVEVRRYRNVGLPALSHVDSARLVRWTRILNGHGVSELPTELEAWMARLELRLVPGYGTANSLESNPQVIAHVLAPSQPPAFPKAGASVKFELQWVRVDGKRIPARSVPVRRTDFSKKGFELYLQVPKGPSGFWHLEPSLVLVDRTLWGHPAEFGMGLVWPGFPDGPESGSAWAAAALQLNRRGFRNMSWGGFSGLWSGEGFDKPGVVLERAADGQSLTLRADSPEGSDDSTLCTAIVWIALPGGRLLEGEFLGTRRDAWRALANRGVTVIASHAPLAATGAKRGPASHRMVQETQHLGDVPRILVVSGNQARGLGLASKDVLTGFDALVLQGPRGAEAAPRTPFDGVPTLFLLPSDPWDSPTVTATQKAVASMDPPAVMAMDLPRYILENLDFLTARAGPATASGGEPR